jgi:excisionase family DNA binding protein
VTPFLIGSRGNCKRKINRSAYSWHRRNHAANKDVMNERNEKNMNTENQYLTVNEVARILRVHSRTVRQWLEIGVFPGAVQTPRHAWRIPRLDVEEAKPRAAAEAWRPWMEMIGENMCAQIWEVLERYRDVPEFGLETVQECLRNIVDDGIESLKKHPRADA